MPMCPNLDLELHLIHVHHQFRPRRHLLGYFLFRLHHARRTNHNPYHLFGISSLIDDLALTATEQPDIPLILLAM